MPASAFFLRASLSQPGCSPGPTHQRRCCFKSAAPCGWAWPTGRSGGRTRPAWDPSGGQTPAEGDRGQTEVPVIVTSQKEKKSVLRLWPLISWGSWGKQACREAMGTVFAAFIWPGWGILVRIYQYFHQDFTGILFKLWIFSFDLLLFHPI